MSEFDAHEQETESTQRRSVGPDGSISGESSTFEPGEDEAADASIADADDHPSEPSGDGPASASAAEGGDAEPMQDAGLGV